MDPVSSGLATFVFLCACIIVPCMVAQCLHVLCTQVGAMAWYDLLTPSKGPDGIITNLKSRARFSYVTSVTVIQPTRGLQKSEYVLCETLQSQVSLLQLDQGGSKTLFRKCFSCEIEPAVAGWYCCFAGPRVPMTLVKIYATHTNTHTHTHTQPPKHFRLQQGCATAWVRCYRLGSNDMCAV